MSRLQVTAFNLQQFISKNINAANAPLLFSLHLLDNESFNEIADALINREIQIEELSRLGGFSQEEVTQFISQILGNWTNKLVANPVAGTDGFAYLKSLGLDNLSEGMDDPSAIPARVMTSTVLLTGKNGYGTTQEVLAAFALKVVSTSLAGRTFASVFPSSDQDLMNLPVTRADAYRRATLKKWVKSVFSSLVSPSPTVGTVGSLVFNVSLNGCSAFLLNPGLANWVFTAPRTYPGMQRLLYAEAARRTVKGAYTVQEVETMLNKVEVAQPGPVSTEYVLADLDFTLRICKAVLAGTMGASRPDLVEKAQALYDALDALYEHRLRVREFCKNARALCMTIFRGSYEAA